MSQVIQKHEMAATEDRYAPARGLAQGLGSLFSSALFCLWLSTASLVVWVDLGRAPAGPVATPAVARAPAANSPAGPMPRSASRAATDAIPHH